MWLMLLNFGLECNKNKGSRLKIRFQEGRGGRAADVLQHNPEKTTHRCSPENRRSNGGS